MLQLGAGGPEPLIRQTASEIRTADAFVDMI